MVWLRWCLQEGGGGRRGGGVLGRKITAPSFIFFEASITAPSFISFEASILRRTSFSDASTSTKGLCLDTRVYLRYVRID